MAVKNETRIHCKSNFFLITILVNFKECVLKENYNFVFICSNKITELYKHMEYYEMKNFHCVK